MYPAQLKINGTQDGNQQDLAWSQNRSFVRYAYCEQAEIISSNGIKIYCRLLDLSQCGCRVLSYTDIVDFQNFRIKLPNIESQRADVIWKDEYNYGVQFRKPLSIYVVEHLINLACAGD